MKIFGQPTDYSEILQRVFYTSVASGLVCTVLVAKASPAVQNLIDCVSIEADLVFLKGIKALYVVIPLVIATLSRMLKLHDRISDIFRIRHRFDTRYILFPLAKGAGLKLTKHLQKKIRSNRVNCMYHTFYPYTGFKTPVIDEQLVRTSADNWGWFWVLIESCFLFVLTGGILGYLQRWNFLWICLIVALVEIILMLYMWFACRRGASRQVEAILEDPIRKINISHHFQAL